MKKDQFQSRKYLDYLNPWNEIFCEKCFNFIILLVIGSDNNIINKLPRKEIYYETQNDQQHIEINQVQLQPEKID